MEKTYNIVELFSGIGSQAAALKNLGVKINTVGTSEWDVHAIVAYDMIHGGTDIPADIARMSKDELLEKMSHYTFSNSGKAPLEYEALRTYSVESLRYIYTSIRRNHNFVDISALEGKEMPDGIDILTYSFPCQDLSNVGAFHGYNKGIDKDSGSRSSLLWQVGRVLTEMKDAGKTLPRFLLMENVPTLLSQRHKKNFETWIGDLSKLGYVSKYYQLNASSFGLPQNRPRLLMISVYVGDDENKKSLTEDYFARKSSPEDVVNDFYTSGHYKAIKIRDLLRNDYRNPIWFEEAVECTPNDTVSRRKIWEDNPQIVLEGNIIILVDNSPSAMILPSSVFDIIEEADDYYFPPLTGTYLRLSRTVIFFLTLFLTPLWLLFMQNPGWIPEWLAFIRVTDEIHVALIYQLLILEFAIDGLRLAAVNTPSMLTTPLSVIAGIVLGEYSVKSGWFNSETMLYMAFVTIANYSMTSFELGYALKFMRVLLLILTFFLNLWGFIAGTLIAVGCLVFNRTIAGKSYIYPLIPFHWSELKKRLLRNRLPHEEKNG